MSCRVFDIPSEHALPESSTIGGAGGSSSEERDGTHSRNLRGLPQAPEEALNHEGRQVLVAPSCGQPAHPNNFQHLQSHIAMSQPIAASKPLSLS